MSIQSIYTPRKDKPMRAAGFMSGSGTNLIKIIEWAKQLELEKGKSPYEIVLIFTDNKNSNAKAISEKFNIPLETFDILDFYRSKGYSDKKDLSHRGEFDSKIVKILGKYNIDLIALAGYMSIVTQPLLDVFNGRIINVHPADLSVKKGGKRKYTGGNAVRDAILAGEKELRSTTHIVRDKVDYGEILLISEGISVNIPDKLSLKELSTIEKKSLLQEIVNRHQSRLKENGDWKIFPLTLQYIAEGRFTIDTEGNVYFDNNKLH
ncbi:MAG: formyltransferase family protein [bacterium]|nr:formyltransferase family protein [bacterium]